LFLHDLLRKEIAEVDARNVVLGGLSQGCAASLVASLMWQGEKMAGFVGMCGWLPFRKSMEDAMDGADEDEGENPFAVEDDGEEKAVAGPPMRAVEWLAQELDFKPVPRGLMFQHVPSGIYGTWS
jgi:acetyl esterase/lipase